MSNNAPIWIIGPPRSRTKWTVNLFKDIPEHIILNHPSFGIYSPFWWRYNKIPPLDAVKEIGPLLEAGKTPVILRHQFAFSMDWIRNQWPGSKFLIADRDIMEWLTSVNNFKGGLHFLYKDNGEEQDLPPAYVGRDLISDWWKNAEWWQRAVAHYWAYMGVALEGYGQDDCAMLYTSNQSKLEDIKSQLSLTWTEKALPNISTFKPSQLSYKAEFHRSDVEDVLKFLNSAQPSQWIVTAKSSEDEQL